MKAYASVNGKPRKYDVTDHLPAANRYICIMDFDNSWQAMIKSDDFLLSLKMNWLVMVRKGEEIKVIPARDITHWSLVKNCED